MKVEKLKIEDLRNYCNNLNINIKKKKKSELIQAIYNYEKEEVTKAKKDGSDLILLKLKIKNIADKYRTNLNLKIIKRKEDMKNDDNSHYLIYQVLGISNKEGKLIDEYQNTRDIKNSI